MGPLHEYSVRLEWTGAGVHGTRSYTAYSRDHTVQMEGKPALLGSADPAFRGNAGRYTPEDLFVAALSQCHMLWFLHMAAREGVVVTGYTDRATGTMRVETAGAGQFVEVTLHPKVRIRAQASEELIARLHQQAHDHCFIARSVNFPVRHAPLATDLEVPGEPS